MIRTTIGAVATVVLVGGTIMMTTSASSSSHNAAGRRLKVAYGEASYLCCDSFAHLVKASPVIVLARIVKQYPSYGTPAINGPLNTSPQPTVDVSVVPPVKATAIANAHITTSATSIDLSNTPPVVLTESTVQVLTTLKGSVSPGQQINIVQPGGTYQGWQLIDRESPLLAVGTTEVLFLIPPASDAPSNDAYQISVGAQARFRIQQNGLLTTLAADSSYLSGYKNISVNQLQAAVRDSQ